MKQLETTRQVKMSPVGPTVERIVVSAFVSFLSKNQPS